jgi:hypothetical protein
LAGARANSCRPFRSCREFRMSTRPDKNPKVFITRQTPAFSATILALVKGSSAQLETSTQFDTTTSQMCWRPEAGRGKHAWDTRRRFNCSLAARVFRVSRNHGPNPYCPGRRPDLAFAALPARQCRQRVNRPHTHRQATAKASQQHIAFSDFGRPHTRSHRVFRK